MTKTKILAAIFLLFIGFNSTIAQTKVKTDGVEVYYFHATTRCMTCQAVEAVTKDALKQYYGDQLTLKSINREEDKDNPLIKKHQISGQTLLILKGDKAVDLTTIAFMNARTKPEKLKEKIKETIDKI